MRVLIRGGGVISTSIAYHPAENGAEANVVECKAVACAASIHAAFGQDSTPSLT